MKNGLIQYFQYFFRQGWNLRSKSRLSWRLLIGVLLFSSVITLLGTGLQLYLDYQRDLVDVDDRIANIRTSHLESLTTSLWKLDDQQLATELGNAAQLKDIVVVKIHSNGGEAYQAGRELMDAENFTSQRFPMIFDDGRNYAELGELEIIVSLSGVEQRMIDRVLVILGTQSLKTFLVSAFILFLTHFMIVRHLNVMAAFARDLRVGRLDSELALDRLLSRPGRQDELDEVVEAVNGMRRDLQLYVLSQNEKLASLSSLAAGMAHELNNPLGAIIQNTQNVTRRLSTELPKNVEAASEAGVELETLSAYIDNRNIPALLDGISEAGEQAAEIIKSLISLSQTSGLEKTSNNLNDLVDNAISMAGIDFDLKHTYRFREIEIVRKFDSALPAVHCVKDEIERVFLAVLRNAAQAMSLRNHPGTITVRTTRHNGQACIEIEDNGPGIESANLNRIFDPFFTTASPQRKGLGLSIAHSVICETHGGQMKAESEPNEGTKIIIELPFGEHQ